MRFISPMKLSELIRRDRSRSTRKERRQQMALEWYHCQGHRGQRNEVELIKRDRSKTHFAIKEDVLFVKPKVNHRQKCWGCIAICKWHCWMVNQPFLSTFGPLAQFSDATSVPCVLMGLASLPRASWTINRSYPSYCCKTVLIGQPSLYLLKIGYSYDSLNKEFGKVDSIGLESALAYTPRQQVIVFAHLIQLDVKILLVSMM